MLLLLLMLLNLWTAKVICEDNSINKESYQNSKKIQPYKFGYEIQDKDGNVQHRHEQDDGLGVRKGSYGYVDANGVYREVQYTADENGFHAKVKSFHKPVKNQLDTNLQSNHQNQNQNHHEPHASNENLKYQFDKSSHHTLSSPNAENIYAKSKVFMTVPGANTPVSYKQDYIYTPTRNDVPLKDNFQRENTNHLHNNIYSDSNSLPLNYEKQKKLYVEPNENVLTERPLYNKIQRPFYREASSPGFVKSTSKYDEKNPNFIEKSNYYSPYSFESKRLSAIKNDLNDENLRNHNAEYDSWKNFPIRKYVASSSHKVTATDKPNLQNDHTPKYDIIYSHQTPSIYELKNETSINQESKSPYHSHKAYKPLQKFKEKYSHLEPEQSKTQIDDSANKKFKQELYLNYYNLKNSGEPSKHHNYYTTKDEIPNSNDHTTLTSPIPGLNSERKDPNYELPNYKENVHYDNHQDYEPKNNVISDEPLKFVDKNAKEYQNVNYLSYSVVKNGDDERSKNIYSKPSSTSTETIETFKQGIKELVPHLRNLDRNHPYGKPIVKTEAPLQANSPDSPQQKITLLLIDPKKAKYSDLDGAAANRPSVKSKFVYKD